ncbi:hypothetical protein BDR06DRAFT_967855 [Suillus hirtellus]|nr:hypothetical protein BDR06DRAFT_967855 [Suillus hirtellus]
MDASKIMRKISRFRILIIGRANAGKTTILKRICNTRENPEIYNNAGEKHLESALGVHDIENEMVFQSNPGFVFHDSRGFEAGGQSEFEKVKAFIRSRSNERLSLGDRIHVIWYCIPMDEDSRSFTEAEVKFFTQCDTGNIAVIVLFTKFDALYDDEFAELISEGVSRTDAQALASQHAKEAFANGPQLKLLYNRKGNQRPPRCHICLADMDKDDADCGILIEYTAKTLDDDTLKQMFILTQRTNVEFSMRYAIEMTVSVLILCRARASLTEDVADPLVAGLLALWVVKIGEDYVAWFCQQRPGLEQPVRVALQQYIASPNAAAVRDAMGSAVRTYEAGFSHLLPGSAKRSQKKAGGVSVEVVKEVELYESCMIKQLAVFIVMVDARAMDNVLLISDDVVIFLKENKSLAGSAVAWCTAM